MEETVLLGRDGKVCKLYQLTLLRSSGDGTNSILISLTILAKK